MEPPLNRQGEIQHALRSFYYPNQEPSFRRVSSSWNEDELLYAMERVETDTPQPYRESFRTLIGKVREERVRKDQEDRRHAELAELMMQAKASSDSDASDASQRDPKAIFIVHGHDLENVEWLRKTLSVRYGLNPIVLSEEAGKGRTIIEKFEDEAKRASFAFVFLTPDDLIQKSNQQYRQARPNVIFELGWFYGRLRRNRVCILFKKGVHLHSDLEGISRIEFQSRIDEKTGEIERELRMGGIIT